MTLKLFLRKINYRWYIAAFITAILLVLSIRYKASLIRVIESIKDLGLSIGYYFGKIFGISKEVAVTVTSGSKTNIFKGDYETFKISFGSYWKVFTSKTNFNNFSNKVIEFMLLLSTFGLSIILLILGVYQLTKFLLFRENNNIGKKSDLLLFHEKIYKKIYYPIIVFANELVDFIKDKQVWKLWLFILLIYFNILTILFEFLAFCFYFFMSFNFSKIGFQGYKFLQDIYLTYRSLPAFMWVMIIIYGLHWLRKEFAFKRLNHMELMNKGFINSLPVVTMVCGTMGKKKTTLITDMTLSQISIFRHLAKESMFKIEMKYKTFDFLRFEKWLEKLIAAGTVYSLASVEIAVDKRYEYYYFCCSSYNKILIYKNDKVAEHLLWGYDWKRSPEEFNDKLQITDLIDDLKTYAKAYLIYITQCYLVSNYSIRIDDFPMTKGNRAIWNDDFFRKCPEDQILTSRYSKVLDFDILRLGKTVVENNYKSGSFEFGVVTISEFGKERLNQKTAKGLKKDDDEANQLNDYFEYWLKLSRHPSTVDYNPYVKVFTDEQRSQSLLADVRELAVIIDIKESSDKRLALPFFHLEEMFIDFFVNKFRSLYEKFRFYRGDNNLFVQTLRFLASKLYCYKLRIYNQFSFVPVKLDVQEGSSNKDDEIKHQIYYLMDKKIYSKRFATDVFKKYFYNKSLKSGIGLNDYDAYSDIVASFDELKKQNSFFVRSINDIKGDLNG